LAPPSGGRDPIRLTQTHPPFRAATVDDLIDRSRLLVAIEPPI